MSWMQRLYETYELAMKLPEQGENSCPIPTSHVSQQAYIEIVLDEKGRLLNASVVNKEDTLLPATEDSATRSSGGAPHPLCDKIQYVAADYPKYGGRKPSYFEDFKSGSERKWGYRSLIAEWHESSLHPKLMAIRTFIEEGRVVEHLVDQGVLHLDEKGKLCTSWPDAKTMPPLFKLLTKKKEGDNTVQDQGDAMVRWRVRLPGELEDRTWKDKPLITSWQKFNETLQGENGLCMVTGELLPLGTKHPASIRHSGDKAKLISSNDTTGYTFRGRFTDGGQACTVGYEVSQKAHNALRWLIQRQAFRNDDQVIVSWEPSGKTVPPIVANSLEAFFEEETGESLADEQTVIGDIGQEYALKLRKKIAGWSTRLGDADKIVILGLDSTIPGKGRMAITLYRELKGSEFLRRLENWHSSFAWPQRYSKDIKFVGAPSPKDIADAAFGRRIDPKLSKSTVNRILPCIVDGNPIPRDLVRSICIRASMGRAGLEFWEWFKVLGIACGLFRGSHKERGYSMALETERRTRDYLYGRLLAIAENIESRALFLSGEKRDTNAAKLMQRFSERPNSTWLLIRQSLTPYMTRLQSQRPSFLHGMNSLLGEIHSMFTTEEFVDDKPLSGEFLLGYYCQRKELAPKKETGTQDPDMDKTAQEEE
jgi:CRISPR-associated protein Csd1